MFKTASRNRQRWLAFGTGGSSTTGSTRPPKRQRLRQKYRPPLTVEAFASAREYLKRREEVRTKGRRVLHPIN
jgi:hypothetical protein